MTQVTTSTYYLDDVISLNDLRPIILRVLKDWTGKRIGIQLAADILEEIMDGCYEHVKEDANEVSGQPTEEVDHLV